MATTGRVRSAASRRGAAGTLVVFIEAGGVCFGECHTGGRGEATARPVSASTPTATRWGVGERRRLMTAILPTGKLTRAPGGGWNPPAPGPYAARLVGVATGSVAMTTRRNVSREWMRTGFGRSACSWARMRSRPRMARRRRRWATARLRNAAAIMMPMAPARGISTAPASPGWVSSVLAPPDMRPSVRPAARAARPAARPPAGRPPRRWGRGMAADGPAGEGVPVESGTSER